MPSCDNFIILIGRQNMLCYDSSRICIGSIGYMMLTRGAIDRIQSDHFVVVFKSKNFFFVLLFITFIKLLK